ncbi:GNAT family N-acetyltransferase [Streptomyces ossamyceticus]|nr:GNAT family N-acetyltransferase [Streptomyces ossamyceticus]
MISDSAPAAPPVLPPSVRPRTDHDLDGCTRVLAAVHERDGYPVNWPERPHTWLTPAPLVAAWVAELDGRVVGHIGLSRADDTDVAPGLWAARTGVGAETTAVVNRLFVFPAARGHGIGALLVVRATAEARARALHPVLDVVESDVAAASLYERLGWHHLATLEQRWSPEQTVKVRCYAAPAAP